MEDLHIRVDQSGRSDEFSLASGRVACDTPGCGGGVDLAPLATHVEDTAPYLNVTTRKCQCGNKFVVTLRANY